jgi:hypothetical protein
MEMSPKSLQSMMGSVVGRLLSPLDHVRELSLLFLTTYALSEAYNI